MHVVRCGSGPAILFVHGFPTNSGLWGQVVEKLCDRFTCFAIDLPGFGRTPKEPYDRRYLQCLAERIEILRIANGIEAWNVVGHDAGCAVAVQYAHMFPGSVSSLALLSPALFPDLKPYVLIDFLRRPLLGELVAPVVAPIFWKIAMARAVRSEEGTPCAAVPSFQDGFTGLTGAWSFMRAMRWGQPCDLLADIPGYLSQLRIPTSILHGSRDAALPARMAERAASLAPHARLTSVDCGHFIPLNRPQFVAAHLTQFLRAENIS